MLDVEKPGTLPGVLEVVAVGDIAVSVLDDQVSPPVKKDCDYRVTGKARPNLTQ